MSKTLEPDADSTKNGCPPTARNARTGEFTPPGMCLRASAKRALDFSLEITSSPVGRRSVIEAVKQPISSVFPFIVPPARPWVVPHNPSKASQSSLGLADHPLPRNDNVQCTVFPGKFPSHPIA